MTKEEFIKKLMKKAPPFVNKEGLPSWLEYAYDVGYAQGIDDAIDRLNEALDIDGSYLRELLTKPEEL